jgi:outer membrane protein
LALAGQVISVFDRKDGQHKLSMMKSKSSIVTQNPNASPKADSSEAKLFKTPKRAALLSKPVALLPKPVALLLSASCAVGGLSQAWAMDLMLALRDASSQDSQLASAQAQLRAVQQRLPQAQSLFLPTVNASANYAQQWTEVNTNPSVNYTSQGLSLSLNQPVFRLANFSTLEQSKLAITQVEAVLAASQQDLALRVAQAYFDVLISQDALITLRSQERAINLQFESAKRNFEVGTATITDQQEAQARLDLTRASVAGAQNDLQTKVANLTLLVGQRPSRVFALEPKLVLPAPTPANEAEWVSAARKSNFSVVQAQIGEEIAKREIDKQRAANYPNVDAVASTSASKGSSPFQPSSKIQNNSIGLQVSVPLYTGGAIAARIAEANALYDKSRQDAETARRAAEQGARSAFLSVNSLMAQAKALEEAEKSSALALESNELGYQVGVRINIDVLNALQQLTSTRRDLSKARYDALLTGLRLKAAAGSLTADDLRSVNAMLKAERPVDIPQNLSGTVFDVPVKVGQPLRGR